MPTLNQQQNANPSDHSNAREMVYEMLKQGLSPTQTLEQFVKLGYKIGDNAPTLSEIYTWRGEYRKEKGLDNDGNDSNSFNYQSDDGTHDPSKYCQLCRKELSSRPYYETHMVRSHHIVVGYSKAICDALDSMNESEQQRCVYRCELCDGGKDFKEIEHFWAHRRTAHGLEPKLRTPRSVKRYIKQEAFEEEEDEDFNYGSGNDDLFIRRSQRTPKPTSLFRDSFEMQQITRKGGFRPLSVTQNEEDFEEEGQGRVRNSESDDEGMQLDDDDDVIELDDAMENSKDENDITKDVYCTNDTLVLSRKKYKRRIHCIRAGGSNATNYLELQREVAPTSSLVKSPFRKSLPPPTKLSSSSSHALVEMPRLDICMGSDGENQLDKGDGRKQSPIKRGYLIVPKRRILNIKTSPPGDYEDSTGIDNDPPQMERSNRVNIDKKKSIASGKRRGRPPGSGTRRIIIRKYGKVGRPPKKVHFLQQSAMSVCVDETHKKMVDGLETRQNIEGEQHQSVDVDVLTMPVNEIVNFKLLDLQIELGCLAGHLHLNVKNDNGHIVFFVEEVEQKSIAFSDEEINVLVSEIRDGECVLQEYWPKHGGVSMFIDAVRGRCYKYFYTGFYSTSPKIHHPIANPSASSTPATIQQIV